MSKKTKAKSPIKGDYSDEKCSQVRSAKHPDAYLKSDLVELAVKKLQMSKTDANKLTKVALCQALKKALLKSDVKKVTKSPVKKAKSKKAKTLNKSPSPNKSKTPKKASKSPKKSPNKDSTGDPSCITRSKIPLHRHQRILVNHLNKHRGVIAAFDVGTGKTLTAVAASQCFLDANPKGKVIVVTPKSLQENFRKELIAYGAKYSTKRYEITTVGKFCNKYENGIQSTEKRPIMLIVDEVHEQRGLKSKRAKILVLCASQVKKVLLLTATPIYNEPGDVLPLVAMVRGDPVRMGTKTFYNKSSTEKCIYLSNTFMFYKNPKTADYPDVKEHHIKLPMTKAYYKAYRDIETQKDHLFTVGNPFRFLTGVRMATNAIPPYPKKDWVIDKILEGGKNVVYSAFLTHGIDLIKTELKKRGIKYVEISGKKSAESRTRSVRRYNNDKVKVMIITKAGGLGLDLKGTKNIILMEKTWNKPNEDQVVGRAARYKSHTHLKEKHRVVNVYHLALIKPPLKEREARDKAALRGSADELLEDIIKRKEKDNTEFRKLLESVDIAAPNGTKCPPVGYTDTLIKAKKSPKKSASSGSKPKKSSEKAEPKEVLIQDKRLSYNRPAVTDKFSKEVVAVIKKVIPKISDLDIKQSQTSNTIRFQTPSNALKKNVAKAVTDVLNYLRGLGTVSLVSRKWDSDHFYTVTIK